MNPTAITVDVYRLYEEMRKQFGAELAWQFILSYYQGAGKK